MTLKTKLKINRSAQCVGCRQCELVCSTHHEGVFAPWLSRVTVFRDEAIVLAKPNICRQCKNAKCQSACPTNAIKYNDNGVLTVSDELCIGCGNCVVACPFDAMGMNHDNNKAFKCDLCDGDPQCVKVCPAHVLIAEVT